MNTIYLDFDGALVESAKKIRGILCNRNNMFNLDCNSCFFDLISKEERIKIYESDDFYDELEFKPGVLDVLKKYFKFYKIIITSKGSFLSLSKKKKWIEENLPFDFEFICLNNKKNIDINSIQIEGEENGLKDKASLKILYKEDSELNNKSNYDFIVVNNWETIDEILDFYKNYNCKTLEKIE